MSACHVGDLGSIPVLGRCPGGGKGNPLQYSCYVSWGVSPWIYAIGTVCASWTWVIISFPILGKFSTIISSSIFSWSFFLSSSSGTPVIQMLGCLTLPQRSLRLSSFLLIRFSFFLSDTFISTILSSTSLILSSASVILLFVPPECF